MTASKNAAATSETNAASSKTAAANSAAAAQTSATSAGTSATTATTKATEAAKSAADAAQSAKEAADIVIDQLTTATCTQLGGVRLADAVNSTDGVFDGKAATPLAVKTAYDLAQSAQSTAAGKLDASGNAATASKLQTARRISLTGGVTGYMNFDGSGDVSLNTILTRLDTSKEPLIKSSILSARCPKMEAIFGKGTKSAHFTGEINSPYLHFLGSCSRRSPGSALISASLKSPAVSFPWRTEVRGMPMAAPLQPRDCKQRGGFR